MRFLEGKEGYASLFLRLGLGFMFVWFGVDKFFNPGLWTGFIAPFILKLVPFSATAFIYVLGVVESLVGTLLLLGFFTQEAALVASLVMFGVTTTIGFNDVTVRDIASLCAAVALMLRPESVFALDKLRKSR